jgi:hypothetical protein
VGIRSLTGGLLVMTLFLLATPAAAQERTDLSYQREIGFKYVALYEEGGYWGSPGVLVEGGYRLCVYGVWRCQVIGEFSIVRFGDVESTYKQLAGGIRFGQLMTPRIRPFVQFQIGWQNDGFDDSNNAVVFMPGGGVNYAVTEQFDLQVMIDIPLARYDGETFNQFRLSMGIGMPLGGN